MSKKQIECPATHVFGPHGVKQMRSVRYFVCGCDAGYCEKHSGDGLFGPKVEPGKPRKCAKHRKPARGREDQ